MKNYKEYKLLKKIKDIMDIIVLFLFMDKVWLQMPQPQQCEYHKCKWLCQRINIQQQPMVQYPKFGVGIPYPSYSPS